MDYLKAFLIGGLICAGVQVLMEKTKLLPGRIMVLLVMTGAVLGFLGLYEPFAEWPEPGHGSSAGLWQHSVEGSEGRPGDRRRPGAF